MPRFPTRPEYRIVFLDEGEEYLQRTGFYSEREAREHMKGISPTRKPQLLRVIAGWPPDHGEDK